MSGWRLLDEPDLDRIGIVNADIGCELYLPHWATAQMETAHSPPECGINAEVLSYHTKDTWTYSLSHTEGSGETWTSAYLLEVRVEYCLVARLQLPFTFGEKLRQKWLERY